MRRRLLIQNRKKTQSGKDSSKPEKDGAAPNISKGEGWNKNVSVFATVQANETSSGTATAGYFSSLKKGLEKELSLRDAHDAVDLDYQTRTRTEAPEDSFVKGKGGKILVIGGDNISQQECDEHAAELKKAYGADVEVIADCSPAKLKAKMEEMSKGSGEQVLVDILAHGAHDDSGKNEGNMALGKKDGDQWLHEQDLKDMVNKNLAPHYKNVNVLIESCYSGNFVQ